jgi:hypothetical protein
MRRFVLTYATIDFFLQWTATAFTIVGAVLTSANLYPYNVFALYIGTVSWTIWAVRIRQLSLIVVNSALLAIYLGGVIQGVREMLVP